MKSEIEWIEFVHTHRIETGCGYLFFYFQLHRTRGRGWGGQLRGSKGSFQGSQLGFIFLLVEGLHDLPSYGSQPLLSLRPHRFCHFFSLIVIPSLRVFPFNSLQTPESRVFAFWYLYVRISPSIFLLASGLFGCRIAFIPISFANMVFCH